MSKLLNPEVVRETLSRAFDGYGFRVSAGPDEVAVEMGLVITDDERGREATVMVYAELKAPYNVALGYAGMLDLPSMWTVNTKINWSSFGTVTPAVAAQYGRMIFDATAIAAMLTAQIEAIKHEFLAGEAAEYAATRALEAKAEAAATEIAAVKNLTAAQRDEVKQLVREAAGLRGSKPHNEVRVMWTAPTADALTKKGVVSIRYGLAATRKDKPAMFATLTEASLEVVHKHLPTVSE